MYDQAKKEFVIALVVLAAGAVLMAAPVPLQPVDEAAYAKLIASGKGKVTLVDFWATWCQPCRKEFPELVALEQKLRSRGFRLVTISCDEPEQEVAAAEFVDKFRAPRPAHIKRAKDDDAFITSIDPNWSGALPAQFLYDRSGRRVRSFIGETDPSVIEAAIRKLL